MTTFCHGDLFRNNENETDDSEDNDAAEGDATESHPAFTTVSPDTTQFSDEEGNYHWSATQILINMIPNIRWFKNFGYIYLILIGWYKLKVSIQTVGTFIKY